MSTTPAPSTPSLKRGLLHALLAFGAWGFFPLYWRLLRHVPAIEQLAHRVVWAAVFCTVLVFALGRRHDLARAIADRRVFGTMVLTAALLGTNWFVFLWAIETDRLVHASLGYYINPLVSVLLGAAVLGEPMGARRWIAVVLAAIGVGVLASGIGAVPWISLLLAISFGLYGLLRKVARIDAILGTTLEALIMLPVLLVPMLQWETSGTGHLLASGIGTTLLLLGAGPITALPIVWFSSASRLLPLSLLGFMQYIAPSMQLATAVLLFGEPFGTRHVLAFVCIWVGLGIFASAAFRPTAPAAASAGPDATRYTMPNEPESAA